MTFEKTAAVLTLREEPNGVLEVKPVTVDWRPRLEINPIVPRPTIEEVSSTGSIIELMYALSPVTLEMSCELEIYP
jgi:hypothetical protein